MFTPVLKLEHSDARGEIYSIPLPGDKELMLLHSKEGSLRGGHCHDVDEVVLLLTGKMVYHKRKEDGPEKIYELDAGTVSRPPTDITAGVKLHGLSFNPAGEYHMGEFLEDTWLIEYKIGVTKTEWRNIDYEPWRERVKANVTK